MSGNKKMMSIAEFYAGRNIFITGGTGFIGKVLVEKLLRTCPNIKGIYLLIRSKRNQNVQERLDKLLDDQIYGRLREDQPEYKTKVHAISGDIVEPDLGISTSDQEFLKSNISIVFHSAATIRFDEPLKVAVQMNLVAVRKMINLCKTFTKLDVFLHVSTAYANCDRSNIDEVVYPNSVNPQKLIEAVEWMDDDMVDIITPKIIGKKPNTYTFTKHLAENLLLMEAKGLPLAIVRPSIVTAAWKEPLPGWVDNYNGASGLTIAAGKGILRTMKIDTGSVADFVPVDVPVNVMITAAWHTALTKPKDPTIFNCTTGSVNPCTWGEMETITMTYFKRNPMDACFRRPRVLLTTNSWLHDYMVVVSHLIPAYITDIGFRLVGKQPRMVKIYNKLHKAVGTMEFFTSREWDWKHANVEVIKANLSMEDKKTFYVDTRALDWQSYMENYCMGTKTYVLKEDESGMPAARAHIKMLRNIRYVFNTILAVALWRILIARSQLARNLWFFIMGLVFKFVRFFRITSTISK